MQTPSDKELYDWLYAMNPLLAGQIRYKAPYNTINYVTYLMVVLLLLGLVWLVVKRLVPQPAN